MARKVLRRSRATQDLLEQALFIANDNLDAAERFLDAAEAAFARLLEMAEIGVARAQRNERLAGLRLWPIPGFERHLIFYLPIESGIEVVRVLDAARDVLRFWNANIGQRSASPRRLRSSSCARLPEHLRARVGDAESASTACSNPGPRIATEPPIAWAA